MYPNISILLDDFVKVASISGVDLPRSSLALQILNAPHKPPVSLPAGKMAVYMFFWKGECMKVGKVGPKSQARFTSQHYSPTSSMSNLAKSIISAQDKLGVSGITVSNVGSWIKTNVDRLNIYVGIDYGIPLLTLLEAFLQCRLRPRFEGFESQR